MAEDVQFCKLEGQVAGGQRFGRRLQQAVRPGISLVKKNLRKKRYLYKATAARMPVVQHTPLSSPPLASYPLCLIQAFYGGKEQAACTTTARVRFVGA